MFDGEIRSRGVLAITLKNNFTRDLRSLDPNDIIGPEGYGELKWVSASERLPYTIRFENDPKQATAPAQLVRIVQTLDSDIDPATVEFGKFGFRGKEFTVPPRRQSLNFDLDLKEDFGIIVRVFAIVDPASSEISWTFSSILPATGAETSRPEDGFLALNLLPPEGDGFVTYTVRAKANAPTGSTLNARARIIFDGNAPIDTPEIFNTLDVSIPTSTIVGQSPTADSRLLVSWDGDDSDPGVGVATFDVYVSENGGRYRKWLSNTNLLESEFPTTTGTTYSFITIVRDHVGNAEADTKLPDASRPLAIAGGPYEITEGIAAPLSGSARDPGGTITSFVYEWDLDYDGVIFDVDSTQRNPMLTVNDGPSTRMVALRVKGTAADAVTSLVATASVKINNAAPTVGSAQSSVSGFVNTLLTNSGSWNDTPTDTVTLSASLGQVVKNSNGTWNWSLEPTSALNNQPITITATDKDGAATSTTFTVSAAVNTQTFTPAISSTVSAITNQAQAIVSLDFGQSVRGFAESDLALVNATVESITHQGNGRYQIALRANSFGTVSIRLLAGSVLDDTGRTNSQSDLFNWSYVDTANMDFGDAPAGAFIGAADYPTRLAQNGARHRAGGPRLGSALDTENDGQPASQSLGDDAQPGDDEDGIQFNLAVLVSSTQNNISSFTVTASAAGKLDAWIDFNHDGDWNDVGEQVANSLTLAAGTQLIPFTVPVGAKTGTAYGRFRISTAGGLSPLGEAADGEVEDHTLTISPSASSLILSPSLGAHQMLTANGQLIIKNDSLVYFQADASLIGGVGLNDGNATVYSFLSPLSSLFGVLNYDGNGGVRVDTALPTVNLSSLVSQVSGINGIGLTGGEGQTIIFGTTDINLLNSDHRLRVNLGVRDTLSSTSRWNWQTTQQESTQLVHRFSSGDVNFIEVDSSNDWQNPFQALDTSGDGTISALDALLVINQINVTSGQTGNKLPIFNPTRPKDFFFADVNGDANLSPLDALLIINHLNTSRSGEGEQSPISAQQVDQAFDSVDFWDLEDKRRRR